VVPQLAKTYHQPGECRWEQFLILTACLIRTICAAGFEHIALELSLERIEHPVIWNAELGVPVELGTPVVHFVARTNRFNNQKRRNEDSCSSDVGLASATTRLFLPFSLLGCEKDRVCDGNARLGHDNVDLGRKASGRTVFGKMALKQ